MPDLNLKRDTIALLLTWEKVCARRKDAPAIDADTVELYAAALEQMAATADELRTIRLSMTLRSSFFPTIHEIKEALEELREDRENERRRAAWAAMVPCVDLYGQNGMAPYWRVRDGKELPVGERNETALHPQEQGRSQAERRLALPAPPVPVTEGERRATILELARRSGMGAAAYMVAVLSGDAATKEERLERTRVEREALKEHRAEIEQADAEREKAKANP